MRPERETCIDGRTKAARAQETQRAPRRKRGEGKQTWTVCRKPGCSLQLRSDNRSGFCKSHHQSGGQCQQCLGLCRRGFVMCQPCRHRENADGATRVAPCTAVGCRVVTHSRSGLCMAHWRVGGPVCKAESCTTRIVFTSRTGFCTRHLHRVRTEQRQDRKGKR